METTQPSRSMARRVRKLELQNRCLLFLAAVAGVAVLAMQLVPHRYVRAREYIVVDREGRDVGSLYAKEGYSAMSLYDADTDTRIHLLADGPDAFLELRSSNGGWSRLAVGEHRATATLGKEDATSVRMNADRQGRGSLLLRADSRAIGLSTGGVRPHLYAQRDEEIWRSRMRRVAQEPQQ